MLGINRNTINEINNNIVAIVMASMTQVRQSAFIAGILAPFSGEAFGDVLQHIANIYIRKYTSFYRDCIAG